MGSVTRDVVLALVIIQSLAVLGVLVFAWIEMIRLAIGNLRSSLQFSVIAITAVGSIVAAIVFFVRGTGERVAFVLAMISGLLLSLLGISMWLHIVEFNYNNDVGIPSTLTQFLFWIPLGLLIIIGYWIIVYYAIYAEPDKYESEKPDKTKKSKSSDGSDWISC